MRLPSDDEVSEMEKLMSNGKRNYICNQPQLALECFVSLCEKLSTFYGQESEKCVEAYLYYGKTLLDIGRLENGVLGPSISETPALDGEAENNEEEKEEAGSSGNQVDEKDSEKPLGGNSVNGTCDDQRDVEDGSDCEASDDEEEADDVSNMELAWEMFELTSVICNRQLSEGDSDDKSVRLMLADAKHGLAQISMETERYDEACEDFNECLKIYTEVLEDKNDRLIAEAHYNIALSSSFNKKYSEAIIEFTKALSILQARILDIEARIKERKKDEEKADEEAPSEQSEEHKEITELRALITDMNTKIEDARESQKLLEESMKTVKNAAMEIFSAFGSSKKGFDDGFDSGFDAGFDAPKFGDTKEVINDCSAKIISLKRKNESDINGSPVKK